MPKREDIQKILVLGSGPIIIGQACEFDYSGTQACKALRKLGYGIVLVNSNPATIMTDPELADATYIEPLTAEYLTEIIKKERPDALIPNLGGQTGLNLCLELHRIGVLEEYQVKVMGVEPDAIERGEDRMVFKREMEALGIDVCRSEAVHSVGDALDIAEAFGYPVVVRPAYTMGGAGGGFAKDASELEELAEKGLSASPIHQILIEESIFGWEELELEVMRDAKDQLITVCSIENVDPVGVHTGDSFCVAPMLTVPKLLQDKLRTMAYQIVRSIGVIGGTNVQFAHDPSSGRVVVIEINPRTSRSSALASKATGFPIAFVSALLACGLTLDEIPCGISGSLLQYIPNADYVVVKFARWAFEKFKEAKDILGTQMRAVGEVMSIGKTFKEAFQKAVCALENGRDGLGYAYGFQEKSKEELLSLLEFPTSQRQFILYEALRKGADLGELCRVCRIKPYFLKEMQELLELEAVLSDYRGVFPPEGLLLRAKEDGFSDRYLATRILHVPEAALRAKRLEYGISAGFGSIRVSGTEDAAYFYSSYHIKEKDSPAPQNKIMILGGGPNRIGQGIEFDYCCVHAALALRRLGFETIMVNCNPETISTDYDTADKLYFEPLTLEHVLSIYEREKPLGVIAQFGGQTPLNLAKELSKNGVNILGTTWEAIDLAEDRDRFSNIMEELGVPMPESGMAAETLEALKIAGGIGYPVMVRPSYVLGGRGMEVIYDEQGLVHYMETAEGVDERHPILIDRFLSHATECEADAICDGDCCVVPNIMEHIELAGVHSGDSACVLPPVHIAKEHIETIRNYTKKIALKLQVSGLMNVQYAIESGRVYVLEANPRASRTVPLVSKICGVNMVQIAVEIITAGLTKNASPLPQIKERKIPYYGVKQAVFPFSAFPEVDPRLGPEMRSTGEALGLSESFPHAYYKAQEAANSHLPLAGAVFLSVNDQDKGELLVLAELFLKAGFQLVSTKGCHAMLCAAGISSAYVNKFHEGSPNITDLLRSEEIQLVINTPSDKKSRKDDSYIRKECVRKKIPCITTMAAAKAAAEGILSCGAKCAAAVKSIQEFHREIR